MQPPTTDHELIRNVTARYSIALDLKDWSLLSKVFTEDVIANYPEPVGLLRGVLAIQEKLQGMLGPLTTQHALTTQLIEITGEKTADATTYSRAIHFGTGPLEGKILTAWGRFEDKLVKSKFDGREDWRIAERRAFLQGPFISDPSLLE